ncbi:MAG: aldo/keto reductase [Dehalococcoidia bacterium]
MRYREIGSTGIKVSELGFGVWTLATTWWGKHDDASAQGLLKASLDLGVNFFDTADSYGQGRGETLLADLTKTVPRESIVIASKFGYDWQNAPNVEGHGESPQDYSVAFVEQALEGALRRLSTDYIDLWQLHNPRMPALENDELFTFLDRAKQAGRIRAVGVALGPAIGWRDEGVHALRERGVDVIHMIYNLLEQDPGRELIEVARESGAGVLVRVPHSSGMLEGKYTRETKFDASDHRVHRTQEWLHRGLDALDKLEFLTADTGMTIGQAALRYVLASPEVASALPNIYNNEQLREFAAASDFPELQPEQVERVNTLYDSEFKRAFAPKQQDSATKPAREAVGTSQ